MDIGTLLWEKYDRRYPTHISIGSTPCTRSFCPEPERGVKTRIELLCRWGVFPTGLEVAMSQREKTGRVVRARLPRSPPMSHNTLAPGLLKVTGSHMEGNSNLDSICTPHKKNGAQTAVGKSHWPRDLGFEQVEASAGLSLTQKSQAETEIYSLVT